MSGTDAAARLLAGLRKELAELEARTGPLAGTDGRRAPPPPAVLDRIARLRAQLGDLQGALKAAEAAFAGAPGADTLRLLGQLLAHQGRAAEAAALCSQHRIDLPEAALWTAVVLIQSGQTGAALAALSAALERHPAASELRLQRASIRLGAGQVPAALEDLREVHAREPHHVGAWLMLARARLVLGDAAGAEQCLLNAERLQPNLPALAFFQLAGVKQERKAFAEAEPYYLRAIAAEPDSFLYRGNYADMLCSIGRVAEGIAQHEEILRRNPDRLRSHLARGLTLPGVLPDANAVIAARGAWSAALEAMAARLPQFAARPVEELEADLRWSNYLLAYHGEDDRPLQERFSAFQRALLERVVPGGGRAVQATPPTTQPTTQPTTSPATQPRRLRVGFASSFFYQCTVGWYFSSWITDLDRSQFEVHVYSLGPVRDALTDRLAGEAVFRQAHHLGLRALADLISQDQLDVLVFPELGLCPTTYALAALRHAPLQCAGWGHPVTSGHASIDLFFSAGDMEPADADAHYSETLVRLPGMGTRYAMPDTGFPLPPRSALGLPDGVALALVSQSLFKLHPDSDALYLRVLAARPDLHIAFFEDSYAANTQAFQARFAAGAARAGVSLAGRVHFLGRMNREAFLAVNRHARVMLDGLRWSGGNTSLDALACGLPLVTLPGRFMRGRQSRAMLQAVECEALIAQDADDYVNIALRLLDDEAFHAEMAGRIRAHAARLFNQTEGVAAFARTLRERARRD